VAALIATAAGLAVDAEQAETWTGEQRAAVLAGLDRLAGVLVTVRGRVVAAERAAASSVVTGDRDFVAARARVLRSGLGVARREVDQAEAVTTLPIVASAVAAGRVPVAHLDVLARAASTAGQVAREALAAPAGQERLVRLAERLSVREFTGAVARLVAAHDPAGLERGVAAQKAARFLHLTTGPDGVHLKGRVDLLAGATLRTALAGVGVAPDATRTKEQADADALVALAERATTAMAGIRGRRGADDVEQDAADARVSGIANRPVVSILVPAETFTHAHALAAAASISGRAGEAGDAGGVRMASGAGVEGPTPIDRSGWLGPVEPGVLEDGTPIAMSQLAQALCDCQLGRIVLGADSVPLDLGRTTRLFTAAQRRAVIVRDRACAWNGCDVPAAYCEVHHVTWWDRDTGPTDYDNAVLLCTHHHHVVHQHDLTIGRQPRPPGSRQLLPDEPIRYEFRARRTHVLVNAPVEHPVGP
jgi:hypothetical protein